MMGRLVGIKRNVNWPGQAIEEVARRPVGCRLLL